MSDNSRARANARKQVHPAVIVLVVILVLALLALVAVRMLGWRGQRVEGQLTALVNPWNGVDTAGYTPSLTMVRGIQVDQSCAQSLEAMLSDCEAVGNSPYLSAGYLSREELENNPVQSAEEETPGFSEHELGLAVDIRDQATDDAAASEVLQWLAENAWQYGFILRYPQGCEESTGLAYTPWHYRYVGEAAATQIQQLNITLEDYVNLFYNDSAAVVFER